MKIKVSSAATLLGALKVKLLIFLNYIFICDHRLLVIIDSCPFKLSSVRTGELRDRQEFLTSETEFVLF